MVPLRHFVVLVQLAVHAAPLRDSVVILRSPTCILPMRKSMPGSLHSREKIEVAVALAVIASLDTDLSCSTYYGSAEGKGRGFGDLLSFKFICTNEKREN